MGRFLPGMWREADAMFCGCEPADDHIRAPAEWVSEGLRDFFTVPATQFCQRFCPTHLENPRSRGRTIIGPLPAVRDDKLPQTKNPASQGKRQRDRGKLHDLFARHGRSKS